VTISTLRPSRLAKTRNPAVAAVVAAVVVSSYWHVRLSKAVLEERQRIARGLHDGPAQELAYLMRHLTALDGVADGDTLDRLRWAVERAQLESWRAINTLAAPGGQALEIALVESAREVAERSGIELELDIVPGIRLSPARTEALVRIACEAVANAARHGGADRARVSLERDGSRVRMRVSDSGRGFNASAAAGGFGLSSMRERARSVGGEVRISSAPGRGCEVEVAL